MSDPTRPLLRYHGGKWRLAPWVISHFPRHRVYVEPFAGAASVLLQKPPARTEIYNDLDGEIVNLFQVVRDPAGAARLCELIDVTAFAREEYNEAYEPCDEPVERARRTVVKSFLGMGSKGIWIKSGFDARVNPDAFISRVNAFRAVPETVKACLGRLQAVVFENRPALEIIDRYAARTDSLIYVDPPYAPESYAGGEVYRHRMTVEDHRALAASLHRVAGKVVLSGYHSETYDELYADWRRVEIGALADAGMKRTEVLWMNFEAQGGDLFT